MSSKDKKDKKEEKKSGGGGGQRSSRHGSITKAGKVRAQTIKIPKTNLKKRPGPRMGNKRAYNVRILHAKPDREKSEADKYKHKY